MKLTQHLDSLGNSANLLSALSYTHPKAFQNTLLTRVSITQVIRDAEPHESALYTSSATKKTQKLPETGASEVLKSRESSMAVLLSTIEKVMEIYPVGVDQARSQVELMRHKHDILERSINELEREVEGQRRRLDDLSMGRGGYDEEGGDEIAEEVVTSAATETIVVTEEMIRAEEEEILRLEQLIESKSRR